MRTVITVAALAVVVGCACTAEPMPQDGSPSSTPVVPATASPGEPSPVIATEVPTAQPVLPVALRVGRDAPHLLAGRDTGFVALGNGHVWASADGLAWDAAETSGLSGSLVSLVEAGDGTLLAFGYAPGRSDDAFRTWTSANGRTWQLAELGLPRRFVFLDIARGERGYALIGRTVPAAGGSPAQLWFSSDALQWELAYTGDDEFLAAVGAGPEGFVAVGQHGFQTGPPQAFVLASADGREWIGPAEGGALTNAGSLWSVVPLHGDWVTSPHTVSTELAILSSANGLDWEQRASLRVPRVDVGVIAYLMSNGSRLFAAVADGDGQPVESNLLTSLDGTSWSETEIPLTDKRLFATSGGVDVFLVDGILHIHSE